MRNLCGIRSQQPRRAWLIGSAILLTLWGAGLLPAQTTTAIISGTVTDASGAVVAGAKVDVKNVGTGITPNPKFTISVYYLGKLTHASGANGGGPQDTTENRVDLAASYSPFTTLFLSAVISALAETGQQTQVQQSYGLTWSPFPDGNLQFTFYYNDNYFPDHSRTIQPTLRWYLGAKRRSYLESSYQYLNSDAGGLKTESNIFSTTLRIFF